MDTLGNRFPNEKGSFGDRLRFLYFRKHIDLDNRGWSQKVAAELYASGIFEYPAAADCVSERSKYRYNTAKTLRLHLNTDSVADISGQWLQVYLQYFGCSADYLFGLISGTTHEKTDIAESFGLSETAVDTLRNLQQNKKTEPLNAVLSYFPITAGILSAINKFLQPDYRVPIFHDSAGNIIVPENHHDIISGFTYLDDAGNEKTEPETYLLNLAKDTTTVAILNPFTFEISPGFLQAVALQELSIKLQELKTYMNESK